MEQQQPGQKKGMSKGCLVALIIVGALLVLVIIAAITCYMKREDLARYGVATMVNGVKQMAVDDPQPGVDTVRVNAVVDAFLEEMEKSDTLDLEMVGLMMQTLQGLPADKVIDSAEVEAMMNEMFKVFPSLMDRFQLQKPMRMEEPEPDTAMVDSM